MPHYFYDKHTAVGRRRCMDTVDYVSRNVNRALEAKRHICPKDVIINRLWQMDNV